MKRPLLWLMLCVIPALATAQDESLRVAYKGELLSLSQTQLIAREPGSSLGYLETEIALLEASLDRMAGLLDDRDLATMTHPNRLPVPGRMPKNRRYQ